MALDARTRLLLLKDALGRGAALLRTSLPSEVDGRNARTAWIHYARRLRPTYRMHRIVAHRLALILLAALSPALAFAASQTYEGQLFPGTSDAPIAIVVQMEELGGFLSGNIRTSLTLKYDAKIDSGRSVAGYCNLVSALSASVTLRLYGDCSSTTFEGNYTIYYTRSKNVGARPVVAQGTFRLTKRVSAPGKNGLTAAEDTASNVTACLKANTRCLAACPRGDTNVEYLCANHCRTKMNACKAKAKKPDSDADSP